MVLDLKKSIIQKNNQQGGKALQIQGHNGERNGTVCVCGTVGAAPPVSHYEEEEDMNPKK